MKLTELVSVFLKEDKHKQFKYNEIITNTMYQGESLALCFQVLLVILLLLDLANVNAWLGFWQVTSKLSLVSVKAWLTVYHNKIIVSLGIYCYM